MAWTKIHLMSCILGLFLFSGGRTVAFDPPGSDGIYVGSSVPSSQTVENNAILTGQQVTVDGTVNGDVLAIGTNVAINGKIQGSLIAIGQRVAVNGSVSGTVYTAALEMDVGPTAVASQNLFFGGVNLISAKGSEIKRDLFAGSMGAQLAGTVDRNIKAIIGPVNLVQSIADAMGGKVVLPDIRPLIPQLPNSGGSPPSGQMSPGSSPLWTRLPVQSSQAPIHMQPVQWRASDLRETALVPNSPSQVEQSNVLTWLEDRLREFVTIALIGLIAIWLIPKLFYRASEKIQQRPYSAAGFGLLELILALNVAGVIGLLLALVFVIGLWLGPRTTWTMSWALWGMGFFSTGLALLLLWLFVFFVSKAIAAYFGGKFILSRLAPEAKRYRAVPLLLGLFIYVLVASIPLIGWVFEVAMIAFGLGAAWLAYRSRAEGPEAIVEVEPAEQNYPREAIDH